MNLVISFSGGETSGFMIRILLDSDLSRYDSVSVVFANTGQEREGTLQFVNNCSGLFGVDVVWIESITNHDIRKSSDYKIVDFKSADRSIKIFESMVKKYGLPNPSYPHCTRELKNEPIKQWCIDNFGKNYEIAIGIRTDEDNRLPKTNQYQTVYPLVEKGFNKDDVIAFWEDQPFRLGIENYQGNCKWCWKKSDRKLRLIAFENEQCFDAPSYLEENYGMAGNNDDGTHRVMFRRNRTAKDIIKDKNIMMNDRRVYLHERELIINEYNKSVGGGCSESCEAFTQESLL